VRAAGGVFPTRNCSLDSDFSNGSGENSVVPLGDLVAEVGVTTATDQFDLVCHLGGHGEEREAGQAPGDKSVKSFASVPSCSC